MVPYEKMICRDCGTEIIPRTTKPGGRKKTQRFADCVYVCPNVRCGVAFSNAKIEVNRRKIYRKKECNIPADVREGLDDVLSHSLNVGNRTSKTERFAFDSSEDAITWTVFRYLQDTSQLSSACAVRDIPEAVLYWGAQHPQGGKVLRQRLEKILKVTLGEDPRRLSEPDVVIAFGQLLVFIEVKHQSPNELKPDYAHFARYLEAGGELFKGAADVAGSGFYELTRNWIAGSLLAGHLGKKFLLINLAPKSCGSSASKFGELLQQDNSHQFQFVPWTKLLERIQRPWTPWFAEYVRMKGIAGDRPCP